MANGAREARATAPGKVILCGEHAVVYGQPAIALPVEAVVATASVVAIEDGRIVLDMPDIGERDSSPADADHPFARLARATLAALGVTGSTGLRITLTSTIPVASGMGSGAALGAALVKAVALHHRRLLRPPEVSALVYQSERYYHGTPSGIDNTVVSFAQPIWYQRMSPGRPALIEPITALGHWTLLLGDTGVRSPTRSTVGALRERWTADPARHDTIFMAIGEIVRAARRAMEGGDEVTMGALLNQNHALLGELGVSSPELDRLAAAATDAGAGGAKLSGGGGGGIMLALVTSQNAGAVETALKAAGAVRVIETRLHQSGQGGVLV